MGTDDETTEEVEGLDNEERASDRSFDPYEGIPEWPFKDPLPGDGRIRRALAHIVEHAANPDVAEPVVLRALGDALEGRVWPEVTLTDLSNLDQRARLGQGPAENHGRELGAVYSADPARVEAIWQVEALRARLAEVHRALLAHDTEAQTLAAHIRLADRLTLVLTGGVSAADESRAATKRTVVLNAFTAVAGLRLPAVVRRLTAAGTLDGARVKRFLRPLEGEDVECVLAIVRARYPEVAHILDEERGHDGLIQKAISNYRKPAKGQRRWSLLISLLDVAKLWSEVSVGRSSPRAANDIRKKDETNLRTTYLEDPDSLGNLEDPAVRLRAWERFATFAVAVGLGAPTAVQLEGARAEAIASEVKP